MKNLSDYRSGLLNPDNLPILDLHGEIGDIARVKINDFIIENYKLRNRFFAIVHGISGGVIRSVTEDTLKKNKLVKEYGYVYRNLGCTVVELNLT